MPKESHDKDEHVNDSLRIKHSGKGDHPRIIRQDKLPRLDIMMFSIFLLSEGYNRKK